MYYMSYCIIYSRPKIFKYSNFGATAPIQFVLTDTLLHRQLL